jgi:hypothetical protein
MDDRITLYSLIRDDKNILIELYFNDQGQLIFDGYDIKNIMEEDPCSSQFQYTYTIPEEEVSKLYSVLDLSYGDQCELLQKLKELFGSPDAFLLMRRFMYKHGIKFSVFAWP